MERHCLGVACAIGSTVLGQFTEKEELLLITCCKRAITSLDQVRDELESAINSENP